MKEEGIKAREGEKEARKRLVSNEKEERILD
jgi:hypothetical protein